MANLLYVFRYFQVVPPIPSLMTGAFIVLTIVGTSTMVLNLQEGAAAVIPVVILQAFAASAGFAVPARRGYFDLLLTRGEPRVRIALVQWLTAIVPGLASWMTLAAVATVDHRGGSNLVLSSGTITAFLLVSTIPWAVTVALPRFSGAIGWLLLAAVGGAASRVPWPAVVRAVVFPTALVGQSLEGRIEVVALATVLEAVTMGVALAWVHRADIPLEAAQ